MLGVWVLAWLGLLAQADLLHGPETELRRWLAQQARPARAGAPAAAEASPAELAERLRGAETLYLDGASQAAARALGALLLDPRFTRLAGEPAADTARYYLASALAREGALVRARQLLLELIGRSPPSDLRGPALRRLVELTLRSDEFEPALTPLASLRLEPGETDEVAYLQGKALLTLGHPERAREPLGRIGPASRLYASARYLLALIALERGDREAAEDELCRLVRRPASGREPFFLSDQAAQAVAHAWLALARLRYERGKFMHAADTYRRVEDDPWVGPRARYELAWSLQRAGRLDAAAAELEALLLQPAAWEDEPAARLLLAYTHLAACRWDEAEALLRADAGRLEALGAALEAQAAGAAPRALPTEVQPWVPLAGRERRAEALAAGLAHSREALARLRAELERVRTGMPRRTEAAPAGELLAERLRAELSRADGLSQRAADLRARFGRAEGAAAALEELGQVAARVEAARERARAQLVRLEAGAWARAPAATAADPARTPLAYLDAERASLGALALRLAAATRSAEALLQAARAAHLRRASQQVAIWARQASLGKVDAVVGRKQALEIEVQNLALGRYPLSALRALAESGALDEGLEYWPYDGEGWPDEYQ
ncbi:MAG TPA: hypothetical protein PK668_13490 [Myxococcota bacterium]|nr:hypothetical protein [Myxococcota bacterium]HRY94124.1 hypothetical protein [Myxococcota bacterium]HSA23804.1 hypothetical protein [Myxococcota bacterium]